MRSRAAARMRRDETQGALGVRTPPHSIDAEQAVLGGFSFWKAGSPCQRI